MSTVTHFSPARLPSNERSAFPSNGNKKRYPSKFDNYNDLSVARKCEMLINNALNGNYKSIDKRIDYPNPSANDQPNNQTESLNLSDQSAVITIRLDSNTSTNHSMNRSTSPSRAYDTTNRFCALISSSSSSESLNEIDQHDILVSATNDTLINDSTNNSTNNDSIKPSKNHPSKLSAFERYNRDRINALDMPRFGHQTHHTTEPESKFSKPGDSIFRNYWRYSILKDGTISCVNAAGNRKKITQLVLRARTAPFEFINGIPVTNYYAMFRNAERLQHISLSGLNLSNVRSLGRMFSDCFELRTVDMSGLDLSNVHDYQHMFDNCHSLKSVDFSGCNMTGAVKLDSMFYGCSSIILITINGLNGSLVESMNHMFRSCESLRILELPNLNISESVEMKKLFTGASKSIDITCPSAAILARYLKDKYDESSSSESPSSSPSIEKLNDRLSGSDNETSITEQINEQPPNEQPTAVTQTIDEFPHVLTEEQRATAFRWAPPPQSLVPEFIEWRE